MRVAWNKHCALRPAPFATPSQPVCLCRAGQASAPGVDVPAKAACHSLTVTFLTVGQAEQETLGTEGFADPGDLTRLHGAARYKLGGKQPAILQACL